MEQLWLTPGLLDDDGFITKSLALPLQWGCVDHHCRAPFWTQAVGIHANYPTPTPTPFLVPSFLQESGKNKISKASVMFLKGGEGQGQQWIGYLVPFPGGQTEPPTSTEPPSLHPVTFHWPGAGHVHMWAACCPRCGPWSPLQRALSQDRVADAHSA